MNTETASAYNSQQPSANIFPFSYPYGYFNCKKHHGKVVPIFLGNAFMSSIYKFGINFLIKLHINSKTIQLL